MARTIVVFLGLIGWAGTAAADSITIVSDQRAVNVLAQVNDSGQTNSQGPGDALSATAAASAGTSVANSVARLTSSLADPAHLTGSGGALASFSTFGTAAASAAAVFAVDFVVDAPYIYSLNGAFNISDFPGRPSNGTFNEGRWVASLSSGDSFLFNLGDTHQALLSNFTGNLPVGTYHFLVETTGAGSSERPATVVEDTQFQFAFDLTPAPDSNPSPTPEPTSVLLVGAGVAGFVTASKTKRAQNAVHRIG